MTMTTHTIALFGEAEKGEYEAAYFCQNLSQLADYLGNPPPNSKGLSCAIQVLLYNYNLLFFRVREEGFSSQDYLFGVSFLENQTQKAFNLDALYLPGVGDSRIIQVVHPFCAMHHAIMIMTEADFYDYLTA